MKDQPPSENLRYVISKYPNYDIYEVQYGGWMVLNKNNIVIASMRSKYVKGDVIKDFKDLKIKYIGI
jgi:hypothetical protein